MADKHSRSRSDDAGAVPRSESGAATAELAVAMPAVVLALTAVIAAGQAVVGQVECVDAARAAARAAARGDSPEHVVELARAAAGGGAPVAVTISGADPVVVQVRRELRLVLPSGPRLQLSARATAQREQPSASQPVPRDAGSATVLVLTVVLLAVALAISGLTVGAVTVARHRAQSAADLAALAGAGALTAGGSTSTGTAIRAACGVAADVADRNDARLVACSVGAGTVLVRAQITPVGPAGRWGAMEAVARAGPAGTP